MDMQQIVLARYCEGLPEPQDFKMESAPLPEPGEGEFRIAHIYNSVDPGTRSRLSGSATYAAAQKIGAPMDGFSVGRVEASNHDKYPAGTLVFFAGGWRTHSIHNGKGFIGPVTPKEISGLPLSYWIGVLGVPGLTAYCGLKETAQFRAGDAVLISSAAGPVGATAGQLAKAWGASKVVGIAGSDAKCDWLTQEAGFDAAINYKSVDDLDTAISSALPDGIDLLYDNVGNAMIERVLPKMRLNGRICVAGQVADYSLALEDRPGIRNTTPFITHQIMMRGLVVFYHAKMFPEALQAMAGMIAKGEIKLQEERFDGLETMPEAFCGLFRGENIGRRVVKVGAE
jgi:NADPH-dependent curcumin reductase CurA